jgi:hypothetical protein
MFHHQTPQFGSGIPYDLIASLGLAGEHCEFWDICRENLRAASCAFNAFPAVSLAKEPSKFAGPSVLAFVFHPRKDVVRTLILGMERSQCRRHMREDRAARLTRGGGHTDGITDDAIVGAEIPVSQSTNA